MVVIYAHDVHGVALGELQTPTFVLGVGVVLARDYAVHSHEKLWSDHWVEGAHSKLPIADALQYP